MGYALESEPDGDGLEQLLARIERLCADVHSRATCLALVAAPDLAPAQLARALRQIEQADG
jgi:hypothetical protein